tara:strand:+ start:239 stop:457 length:219 start_codon:yes stop_codon:yes gene_type:complete
MAMIHVQLHYVEKIEGYINDHSDFQVLHLTFTGTDHLNKSLIQEISIHSKGDNFADEALELFSRKLTIKDLK